MTPKHFSPVKIRFILGWSNLGSFRVIIFASYLATKTIKMFWGHIHKNLEEDKNLGV